jgi:transcription elongation GreA/GreB family factor
LSSIDKSGLLDDLRRLIQHDLDALERSQLEIQRGATHEENRIEHAKDTRATEQSYLARGLSERVERLRETADAIARLEPRAFCSDDPIAVSALVTLEDEEGRSETWWVVPLAGGLSIPQPSGVIRTVTPVAPLGRALIGLSVGDEGSFVTPRGPRRFEVLDVC